MAWHAPRPPRPLLAAGAALVAAALAGPAAAQNPGRAQVGVAMGIYSTWDLDPASSITGSGWRDGALVSQVSRVGDPPSASIQVYDAVSVARVEMQAQSALLQAGGAAPLPVGGERAVESDLAGGTLRLRSRSDYVAGLSPFGTREAYAQGLTFAELFQSFEVRWAIGHAGPIELQLSMTVDGEVLRNDGSDGWIAGLGVYLDLGNVATGRPPLNFPLPEPVARFEAGASGQPVSIGGGFVNSQCFAAAGYCESFVSVYAAMDMRGRRLSDGSFDAVKGAAHDFDFVGQLALTSSPGLTILRVDNQGPVLPPYAWVNPAPVPEPGSALMLAAGLAGLVAWRRRAALS